MLLLLGKSSLVSGILCFEISWCQAQRLILKYVGQVTARQAWLGHCGPLSQDLAHPDADRPPLLPVTQGGGCRCAAPGHWTESEEHSQVGGTDPGDEEEARQVGRHSQMLWSSHLGLSLTDPRK